MNKQATFTFAALPRAARSALQWRLLLLWVLAMLIPTAILTLPVWQLLSANLDYSVHADAIARQLDATVFADLMAAHGKSSAAFTSFMWMALAATLLLSPLLSGMTVTAARARDRLGMGALMSGALAEYPRMLRMLLWAVVPLGLAVALGSMAIDAADDKALAALTAADADLPGTLAMLLMALLLALANASLDAGRATLAVDRRRSSALKAWWQGCTLLLRRPLAGLGVYIVISAAGLALAAALSAGRLNVAGAGAGGLIAALALTVLTVLVIGWMRSARLFAMVELAHAQEVNAMHYRGN
ncbi:MAG: hypothetical protein V4723_15295 [Pseudomonadota bacterium]